MVNSENITAPAPWDLTGEGFILLYKFPKEFIEKNGFLADYQKEHFKGGFGTVMCVNYTSSNVGPYFELLFIPGIINLKNLNLQKIRVGFTISKIYVSSQNSVNNGMANWGIPKELADFQWNKIDENNTDIKVSIAGEVFFEINFKKWPIKFPINTAFIPLKIIQKMGHKIMLTKPKAKGWSSFVKLKSVKANPAFFPPINDLKPILVTSISNFKMVFPEALVSEIC